ncbi:hypothetical protein IFVP203_C1220097 [Vibrio parahaemolyticus]|nr:hypothetical protein CGK65_17975 [Vibrio parahaemolyticus]
MKIANARILNTTMKATNQKTTEQKRSELLQARQIVFTDAKRLNLDEFMIRLAKLVGSYKSVTIYENNEEISSYDTRDCTVNARTATSRGDSFEIKITT